MNKIILMILCLVSLSVHAEADYSYLLKIIDNELAEVNRLNKQIQASDSNLLLRMAELYLERGRVVKEQENEKFLSIPVAQRRTINKNKFFVGSKNDLSKAYKLGGYILKKFPQTKIKGDVFYILAFYAQEFQGINKAKKYFDLAKKYSENNSSSFKKASLALADIFYNEKNFKQAISNYENAIDDKDSKWWTRDAFNLAWCYFREGEKNKGINLMKEVHQLSNKGSYLNLKSDAERDLAYFFADTGRVKEADQFIKKNGENPDQYIRLAKNLIDQGKSSQAIHFLVKASAIAGLNAQQVEINNMLLNLYEKFGEAKKHYEVAAKQFELLKQKGFDSTYIENLNFQLKKMTSSIQEKIKSNRYADNKKFQLELADIHLGYVKIIENALPKLRSTYLYYQAEIDYAIKNYERAASNYLIAFNDQTRRLKKSELLKNILACLSQLDNNSDFYKTNAQNIYEKYLVIEKDSKLKKPIYPLLFDLYVKNSKIESAEKILNGFNKYFKTDMKTIEAMLANLLNLDEIKNNKLKFLSYVKRINEREFIVGKNFVISGRRYLY